MITTEAREQMWAPELAAIDHDVRLAVDVLRALTELFESSPDAGLRYGAGLLLVKANEATEHSNYQPRRAA